MPTMTGTHIGIYACHESKGVFRPVNDTDGLIVTTVNSGEITVISSNTFPLGFIKIASFSDAVGTLETEAAERTIVVMVKP